MFKMGDFIIHQKYNGQCRLYIAIDSNYASLVADDTAPGVFKTQPDFVLIIKSDKPASTTDVEFFRAGKVWPNWVSDILLGIDPRLLRNLPPGYMDSLKPNPASTVKPIDTRMTLQMFQEQCQHIFKEYVGFSRIYRYCTICDKKEI